MSFQFIWRKPIKEWKLLDSFQWTFLQVITNIYWKHRGTVQRTWTLVVELRYPAFIFRIGQSYKSTVWERIKRFERLYVLAMLCTRFKLNRVRDMTKTYSQMHRTDKYSQLSSIIWPIGLNGWMLVYELSGCEFASSCSHLNFRFSACFEQGVPWHLGNYWVWTHSETCTWHDKNIQSNAPSR